MSRRFRGIALAALLVANIGVVVVTARVASADTVICDQSGGASIQSGRSIVQNNRWGSTATQCINVTAAGFSITQQDGVKATNEAPSSYPSVYYGCHHANCSSGTILPLQASTSAFAGISTSVRPVGDRQERGLHLADPRQRVGRSGVPGDLLGDQ